MSPRITRTPCTMSQITTTAVNGPEMAPRPDCTALAVPLEKIEAYWVAKPEKVSTFMALHHRPYSPGGIDPPNAGSPPYEHCCNKARTVLCRRGISVQPLGRGRDARRSIAASERHPRFAPTIAMAHWRPERASPAPQQPQQYPKRRRQPTLQPLSLSLCARPVLSSDRVGFAGVLFLRLLPGGRFLLGR